MSWFKSKHSNNHNDKRRKKQIQSMCAQKCYQTIASQTNRNSFTLSFKTRTGQNYVFVELTDQLPDVAPRLRCDAKYSHPILDVHGYVIGIDELNRWNAHNSDLGRVCQACVLKMIASPPTLKMVASHAIKPVQPIKTVNMASKPPPSYQSHLKIQQQSPLDMAKMKLSVPQRIPQFEQLSNEEIEELSKNENGISDLAYQVASTLQEMRKNQQSEVIRIAKSNLNKKESIASNDQQINDIREEVSTLTECYKNLKARQDKVLKKFSKSRIRKELNNEIEKLENQCQEIKDKYDNGDIAPAIFAKKYVVIRSKYHLIAMKQEKLKMDNVVVV